jgi:hypothetical protein
MKHRMTSRFDKPSLVRRARSSRVGWCQRNRTTTIRYEAVLAWRLPPGSGDGAPSCPRRPRPGRRRTASRTRPRCVAARRCPGRHQQRPGDLSADPAPPTQPRCRLGGGPVQLGIHRGQLGVQGLVALAQKAQGQLGRRRHRQDRPWAQPCRRAGQPADGQAPQLPAEPGRGGHHQRPQGVGGLGAGLDGGGPGHPQAPDHLHQVAAGLGDRGGLASQHRPSRSLGIDGVGLARRRRAERSGRLASSTTALGRRGTGPGQPPSSRSPQRPRPPPHPDPGPSPATPGRRWVWSQPAA